MGMCCLPVLHPLRIGIVTILVDRFVHKFKFNQKRLMVRWKMRMWPANQFIQLKIFLIDRCELGYWHESIVAVIHPVDDTAKVERVITVLEGFVSSFQLESVRELRAHLTFASAA